MTSQSRDSQERKMPVNIREIRHLGASRLKEQGIDTAQLIKKIRRVLVGRLDGPAIGQKPRQVPSVSAVDSDTEEKPRRLMGQVPDGIETLVSKLCTCPDGQGRLVGQGETLFGSGQEATIIFLIRQGVVRLNYLDLAGKRLVLELRFAGDLVGERALAQRVVHEVSAVAVTQVRVCECRRADFLYAIENNPRLLRELIHRLADYALRRSEAAVRLCGFYGAHEKTAFILLKIAQQLGEPSSSNSITFQLPFQRKDFAELVGVSTKTLIRTFSEWTERGWLEIGYEGLLTIHDMEKIRALTSRIWLPETKEV